MIAISNEYTGNNENMLRQIGMLFLFLFFFLFCIGNAIGVPIPYELVFYFSIIIAILLLIIDPTQLSKYKQYFIWQAVFLFAMLVSCIYTINTENRFDLILSYCKIILKITTVVIICRDFGGLKKLLHFFSFLGFFIFLILFFTGRINDEFRLGTDLLGNANTFAMLIMVMAIGSIYYVFTIKKKILIPLYLVFSAADLYLIFLSGGRKFIIFLIVFVFVSFIIRTEKGQIKNAIISVIVVSVLVLLGYQIIMATPALYKTIGIRLIGVGTEAGALGTSDQKTLMFRGIEMFVQKPIFGFGIGGYQQYSYYYYDKYIYSHSNYIELLANFGIVGFSIYYFRYLKNFAILLKQKHKSTDEMRLFLPLMFSIAFIDVFSVSFNQTAFIPLFIMFISGFADDLENTNKETKEVKDNSIDFANNCL